MPNVPFDQATRNTTVVRTPQLRRLGQIISIMSVVMIWLVTLVPQGGQPDLSPFCLVCGSVGALDAVLNVLLFLPLGIGLALAGIGAKRALIAMLLFSGGIEVAQSLVVSGRDATIRDVLTNSLGGAAGIAVVRLASLWLRPTRRSAAVLVLGWSVLWLSVQVISSYAFVPSLPQTRYYAQIARTFRQFATFEGDVLAARIDTAVLVDFGFARGEQFRAMLLSGAMVSAIVVPAGPTSRIAPIVRVAEEKQREIVLLAQNGSDLVFGLRTGAADLRLRSPLFRLREVFPAAPPSATSLTRDTLRLGGRYRKGSTDMVAWGRAISRERSIAVDPALGWTLFWPRQWYIEGTRGEDLISLAWLAFLLLPLGYWGFYLTMRASATSRGLVYGNPWPLLGLAVLGLTTVGLVIVPRFMGLPSASFIAWLAGIAGLVGGASIARRIWKDRTLQASDDLDND